MMTKSKYQIYLIRDQFSKKQIKQWIHCNKPLSSRLAIKIKFNVHREWSKFKMNQRINK